jgi:hypothetical protein
MVPPKRAREKGPGDAPAPADQDDSSDYGFFCQLLRQSGLEVLPAASRAGDGGACKTDAPMFLHAAASSASVRQVVCHPLDFWKHRQRAAVCWRERRATH